LSDDWGREDNNASVSKDDNDFYYGTSGGSASVPEVQYCTHLPKLDEGRRHPRGHDRVTQVEELYRLMAAMDGWHLCF